MRLDEIWLSDFRSYPEAHLELSDGLTVVTGPNGQGKTNLLEAVGFIATTRSFRGAPNEALIRSGSPAAVVRARLHREEREVLIEAEIPGQGRPRLQVNRQRLKRVRDLLGAIQVSVFSPDDLELVKGSPSGRRRYLDDLLVARRPQADALRTEVERVLRQRNALLKQAGGRMTDEIRTTLDVWNTKLIASGEQLAHARVDLVSELLPLLCESYDAMAGGPSDVRAVYDAPWLEEGLASAIEANAADELRRGVSLVGPQRDDLLLSVGSMPARTHASQGEQRSLALALRLAGHRLVAASAGTAPVLLLDDIFSELDPSRSSALLSSLPTGQAILTTAGIVPPDANPAAHVALENGVLTPMPN